MMMARKWDRIESICERNGWDIFEVCKKQQLPPILASEMAVTLNDIKDLRCYLLLIEEHVRQIHPGNEAVEGVFGEGDMQEPTDLTNDRPEPDPTI